MDFLGVTSVEDMLSERVDETISILKECGIKVYLLSYINRFGSLLEIKSKQQLTSDILAN